ncbi:MAG: AAA family ATPase [Spirochaetia bacterium]|nr:AAA family ATPase [Spirochaetia bacterium]
MSDLFSAAPPGGGSVSGTSAPLADRMRPRTLDEFIGQEHIVGPGKLLRRAIQRDRLSSIILSGPPGTGKTTLARIIANSTSSRFVSINAVLSGVQAIRDAIESATRERDLYDRRTILFVDEVHRWNKAQQDALLPWVENGTIILIGATTENPYFEVNRALVSRSRVFQLASLGPGELAKAAAQALADAERGYGRWKVAFDDGALEHLVDVSDGDARSLLNALELAVETSASSWPPPDGSAILVTMAAAEESIQKRAVLYDRDGDYHYDAASALIKSIRGSDPDAALYWTARMVYAGEDPRFLFRRLLISAAEDVGLADPSAIGVVNACAAAYERIGLPEGQFHLAEAALYLATAPKSNSAMAYFDALAAVERERAEVPDHLKDASRDADGLGHGQGYLYPHAYKGHWIAQRYLPSSLGDALFYQPGAEGYESAVREKVLVRRDAQLAAWLSGEAMAGKGQGAWTERAEAGSAHVFQGLKDAVFKAARLANTDHVLILNADNGLLAREATRLCTEGSVCALVSGSDAAERLSFLFRDVEDMHKPAVLTCVPDAAADTAKQAPYASSVAAVLGIGFLSSATDPVRALSAVASAFSGARFVLAERMPAAAGLLPSLAAPAIDAGLADAWAHADSAFYTGLKSAQLDADAFRATLEKAGLAVDSIDSVARSYPRELAGKDVDAWLSSTSAYGAAMAAAMTADELERVRLALKTSVLAGPISWPTAWLVAAARS